MTTNETLDMHRPTAEFRDFLEGEVIREYRRRRTFRRLRAAAVILVSVGVGMSATLASAQVRESSAKDSLLAAAQADAALVSMRLNLARLELEEERKQVSVGARPAGRLPSEGMVKYLEASAAVVALNMAEIEKTAQSPRDELNAPLVSGRDFVKERMQIELMLAQDRLSLAEQKLEDATRRVRVGAATELESADYETSALGRRGEMAVLAEKLKARQEFLDKGTDVRELTRRVERTEVQQAIQVAQRELVNARARKSLVEQRQKVGAATKLEVLQAEMSVVIRDLEIHSLARRLKELTGG
jgi:outer membrane protein TolC